MRKKVQRKEKYKSRKCCWENQIEKKKERTKSKKKCKRIKGWRRINVRLFDHLSTHNWKQVSKSLKLSCEALGAFAYFHSLHFIYPQTIGPITSMKISFDLKIRELICGELVFEQAYGDITCENVLSVNTFNPKHLSGNS